MYTLETDKHHELLEFQAVRKDGKINLTKSHHKILL